MINNHALNKLLADVAGVEVETPYYSNKAWVIKSKGFGKWDPIYNANQMERVKAGLRREKREIYIKWDLVLQKHLVWISQTGTLITVNDEIGGIDESEAMALAMAIEAMKNKK